MTQLNPHGRACFSDAALKAFREFVRIDNATVAQRPRGAQDAQHPQLSRALARDRRGMARDDLNSLDPDTIENIHRLMLEAGFDDDVMSKFMTIMEEVAPGCLGDLPGLKDNTEDEADADNPPGNPNPNRNYSGKGTEAFDNPPPFPGMPKPGGKMVPQRNGNMAADAAMRLRFTDDELDYNALFPNAGRIGLDPCPTTPGLRSTAVRPVNAAVSRRGLALDHKMNSNDAAADYEKLFGPSGFRVL